LSLPLTSLDEDRRVVQELQNPVIRLAPGDSLIEAPEMFGDDGRSLARSELKRAAIEPFGLVEFVES